MIKGIDDCRDKKITMAGKMESVLKSRLKTGEGKKS
jgi:hypothetical protein